MTDELNFELYLSISKEKYVIYLLDKKNLKNIYKKQLNIENDTYLIDGNLLKNFLDQNIFKIEKLIGTFLRSIVVIIENEKILNFSIGIKKKNYGEKINKNYLESCLGEVKDLFKENYQNNKIIHFIIKKYFTDGVDYKSFDQENDADHICVEVNFISVPNILIKEISNVLEKHQIKIDRLLEKKYIKNLFDGQLIDESIIAFKVQNGYNQNEIVLVPKSGKKTGIFEKFFQLFS